MRSKIFLALTICSVLVSCDLFNSKKYADVIMVDGPRYEEGNATFSYTGTVRNIGEGKALFVRISMELRNPDDILLAQGNQLVDKTDLEPGESSTWRIIFDDADREIRDLMDESKRSYDITWRESEED
jgi:hypothetical protein